MTNSLVTLEPEEAELAKLFTNAWRYIKFAAANQFYMMANDRGLDFEKIDVRDKRAVDRVVAEGSFDAVIHLAAQVAVTTSVVDPLFVKPSVGTSRSKSSASLASGASGVASR